MAKSHSKRPVRHHKVRPATEDTIRNTNDAVTAIGAEWEDDLFRQHKVYEKLITQTKDTKPSSNWRAELDDL